MRPVIELRLNGVTRPSFPVGRTIRTPGIRVAPLDQEIWNHPVKGRTVIKTFAGQLYKITHVIGGYIREEAEFDIPELRGNDCPSL
jgi:hypothetical protein